ncbi:hypothetical protein GF312_17445 [Candidatus Poribacteria bacterium]|nr:hypothetical protein [Candidatus Poribacteria bacterium]
MRSTTERALTRRRRSPVRRSRARCRICGVNQSKRFCPAVNTQICPACCSDMRPDRPECERCRYNFVNITSSRIVPEPDPKFLSAVVSDTNKSGMMSLAMAWKKPNDRLIVMFFLLDFWKTGMADCFVDVDISEEDFDQKFVTMAGKPGKKQNMDEAKRLVKRALHISQEIKKEIPWDYNRWRYLLGDMTHIPLPGGSLYKCASCGADLPEPIVDVIKDHALLPEAHFYMVCEKCAGEFED